jgi:AbiJ N-terminal domain 4
MKLFSQRKASPIERYTYELSEKVRSRIFHTLHQLGGGSLMQDQCFKAMLAEVGQQLLARLGGMKQRRATFEESVVEYWASCSNEEALDFIEICFQTQLMGRDTPDVRLAVEKINTIFEEEGVGYELTPPALVDIGPGSLFGRTSRGVRSMRMEFPKIVKKAEGTVHDHAVKPALEVLRDDRFATANSELLDAFEKVRKGKYADAITSCGSAFESVMKTIYDLKKWTRDPKDTCAQLVEIGRAKGLFWPFYTESFKAVGIIRNNLGDAHGKGPAPTYIAEREHAEHMIALTCTHIAFLVGQAALGGQVS